jgi:hypothetical protein
VIGEGGLLNALHKNGYAIVDKSPDYVVVGEGRTLSSESLVDHGCERSSLLLNPFEKAGVASRWRLSWGRADRDPRRSGSHGAFP